MDIEIVGKGLFQRGDVGDMGENAQLDLAVVGRDQFMSGLGDKGRPDLPAFGGADRNILQIRIGRGEPAG